ncbi:MAG: hypothetical protein LQ352_003131 [Teloschistes flavicans]|nr:MAG: hypothetical protein LQ352_003131 [Teloschistes flavicans]
MHISETPTLTPKAGRVQKARTQISLPLRRKRSQSYTSVTSEKRPRPSQELSFATSTGKGPSAAEQIKVNSPCLESWDDNAVDEAETDNEVPVIIEETELARVSDTARLSEFFRNALDHIGQTQGKKILKEWVKLREQKKQSRYPYNGGLVKAALNKERAKNNEPVDQNPGRDTAPPWWPNQDGYQQGRGCRHKEADHVKKPERLYLMPLMLRFTGRPDHPDFFNLDRMRGATDKIGNNAVQTAILNQIYLIREAEQAFEEGGTDGDTCVYVTKHMRPLTRKQKKAEKKSCMKNGKEKKQAAKKGGNGKGVKGKSQAHQRSTEQSTPASTPSTAESTTECVDSSFSSHFCSSMSMSERSAYDTSYPDSRQSPSAPQYPHTPLLEGDDSPVPMSCSPDYHNALATAQAATTPLFQGSRMGGDALRGEPMALPPTDRGRTLGTHSNYRPRRYMSVARQASSSYDNGVIPLREAYDFIDDQSLFGFRMPRISHGRPTEGLPYPITSSLNHSHGLPPEQQFQMCATHNCSHSHTHGWRPPHVQARICAEHNCSMDPESHEFVPRHPGQFQPMPNLQYASGVPAPTVDLADIEALMEAQSDLSAPTGSFH